MRKPSLWDQPLPSPFGSDEPAERLTWERYSGFTLPMREEDTMMKPKPKPGKPKPKPGC
jgi:hypothetical protein